MEFSINQVNQAAVVSIVGSIDAKTAEEVSRLLEGQVSNGSRALVADLSGVDFMSSAGLRVFLGVTKAIRSQGGDFRLAGVQTGVAKTLNMAGFNTILKIFPSVGEAVESFGGEDNPST